MEKTEIFTISYINKKLYKKFTVYGSKSRKDINKEEVSREHIKFLDDFRITFEEADEVFELKLIIKIYPQKENVNQDILDLYEEYYKKNKNKSTELHAIYKGVIIGHYKRDNNN